jgi:hypothetical protein
MSASFIPMRQPRSFGKKMKRKSCAQNRMGDPFMYLDSVANVMAFVLDLQQRLSSLVKIVTDTGATAIL